MGKTLLREHRSTPRNLPGRVALAAFILVIAGDVVWFALKLKSPVPPIGDVDGAPALEWQPWSCRWRQVEPRNG